jgi:hypothetical protein
MDYRWILMRARQKIIAALYIDSNQATPMRLHSMFYNSFINK